MKKEFVITQWISRSSCAVTAKKTNCVQCQTGGYEKYGIIYPALKKNGLLAIRASSFNSCNHICSGGVTTK